MIVVDAGTWVRALVDYSEEGSAAKAVLTDNPRWFAPAHAPIEVLRTLRRYEAAQVLSPEHASELALETMTAEVRYFGPEYWILEAAWRLRNNISGYDAPYVAIAQTLKLPLVTFDIRPGAAASKLGLHVINPGDDPDQNN